MKNKANLLLLSPKDTDTFEGNLENLKTKSKLSLQILELMGRVTHKVACSTIQVVISPKMNRDKIKYLVGNQFLRNA